MEKMNILYCGDCCAFIGLEASLYSLLTYNSNLNIYIFTMDYERDEGNGIIRIFEGLNEAQKIKLQQLVKYLDKYSHITFIDTLKEYQEYFLHGVNENDGHSSPYAPLRLLIDILLPEVKHILYLDCDTIIQGDIQPMYFSYLQEISASKDCCYAAYPNIIEGPEGTYTEMVAGVLLFDMNKAKTQKLLEQARYNITHNIYQWYDQSALEAAGNYIYLPQKYNYMKEYEYRKEEPVILHFADSLNPKIYFEPEIFYKKFPHLQYIKDGIAILDSINF